MSLQDSLMARLDRLASVRLVAQIGAAIGREFSYALLHTVARLPEQELQTALARLVASELVFQRGTPPEAVYIFKHALVQDTAAIQKNGLKLEWHDGKVHIARMKAVNKPAKAGKQDIVVLAVKAHFLDQVVRDIDSLLDPDTVVLTVQNGLPWWYFQRLGGQSDNRWLESLDPSGILTKNIDPNRIIGCVVYPAAAATAPGVIHHVEGDRFPIGELDGKETERVKELHDVFIKAGLKSLVLPDIRSEIWLKSWGNLSFNPISALTHATLVDICQFAETRELAATMMKESQDIAQKLGVTFRVTIDKRIAGAEAVGAHKTSMLQDVEAGRSLETEALIGSILEMAKLTRTSAPAIEAVYALVKLLNRVMLTEGGGVKLDKSEAKAA